MCKNHYGKHLLPVFLFFSIKFFGFGIESFLSDESFSDESLIENIYFLKDSNFDKNSILEQDFILLRNPRIGYKNTTYWFKVILIPNKKSKNIIFNINESSVDCVEIYNNLKLLSSTKESIGFTSLSFNVKQQSNNTYFLKVNFPYQVNFPLTVLNINENIPITFLNLFKTGGYYGFVLMVLIINLFFYFSLREKTFLYYSLFLLAINLGISHYDGLFNIWLDFDTLFFTTNISHFIIPFAGALFATSFLNLNDNIPKSKYLGFLLLLGAATCYLIHLWTKNYYFFITGDIFALLILFYYWIMGLLVIKLNDFAIFFVVGYCLVLMAAVLFIISMDLGIYLFSTSLEQVKFGALIEMLILTYAITYRVKKMNEENELNRNSIQKYIQEFNILKEQMSNSSITENKSFEFKINEITQKFKLTEREVDVLLKLYEGCTNKKIADELFISLNTVKYHTKNIYKKLDIGNKGEVISLFV